ncbi:MAG: hypothetical protein BWY74_00285 [Firmicutes bacterium ADurb.Bin419]|nr:MAG: hypothetical protein BWY74_00285 [Firmicutes bacterium ADurb.Bin419]
MLFKPLVTIMREAVCKQYFERTPEPEAIMSGEKVQEFDVEGNPNGTMAAPHLYIILQVSRTVSGCKRVLDLG